MQGIGNNNWLSAYNAQNAYPSSSVGKNPFGGASVWGQPGAQTGITQEPKGVERTGAQSLQSDLREIGSLKNKGDFENGLGGTNNPDDHKLFCIA